MIGAYGARLMKMTQKVSSTFEHSQAFISTHTYTKTQTQTQCCFSNKGTREEKMVASHCRPTPFPSCTSLGSHMPHLSSPSENVLSFETAAPMVRALSTSMKQPRRLQVQTEASGKRGRNGDGNCSKGEKRVMSSRGYSKGDPQ